MAPPTALREAAVLDGGPAHGARTTVTGRPRVLQVTVPCRTEGAPEGVRVEATYVYRLDPCATGEPLRYGFDLASP
ncbi:hypothetical protein IBX28_04535 [Streptomyces sp. SHP 1-2]|uniref:hypothetical protein n=1 Tax=unclassified Streptomyces TaxID=2593676 RepID=UPI001371B2C0|nr:hypothetical protein [Streptomyces sp. SHP 1-2]MCW5249805.1 hypothetical protein [Streptomyces sp. SHP 1-2]MYU20559.1 hypothetical protein [Streptomyces sp. SID8352]